MRSMKMALAGLAILALAGCSTLSGIYQAVTDPPSATTATTVYAAEQALTQAANLEVVWLKSGAATPAKAATAKDLRSAVYADIVAARTAVANKDSVGAAVALKLFNQALPAFTAYMNPKGGGS